MAETKINSLKTEKKKEPREEKRAEKVVKGNVKVRKKSEARKLADTFIAEDARKVKDYVWSDVLVPTIKKAISDIIVNGVDILLYGESGKTKRFKGVAGSVQFRDYNSISRERRSSSSSRSRSRSSYTFDDIIFETRGEAEAVLVRMDEIMDRYGFVRVADFYELAGVTGTYTDNSYGWDNIYDAEPVRVRDGYLIKLPRAIPID